MLNETKIKIDKELFIFASRLNQDYQLKKISPLLAAKIKEYILRPGKRIRPILFILGYLAYAKKPAAGLFKSALSIELLHDFMLIHDDIIDKSDLRRGKPALHKMFNDHFAEINKINPAGKTSSYHSSPQQAAGYSGKCGIKFSGQDLAIIAGDILYALAMDTFLAIRENPLRKEKALKKLISAALYTGCGEFFELVNGVKSISQIQEKDIYKIYDLKTAYYTFAYPLSIGASLAGAPENQVKKIFEYGVYTGRAFQIQDDILGMFADEKKTGKSALSDLQEAKKTLLIWKASRTAKIPALKQIKQILDKRNVTLSDLIKIRELIKESGSLKYAQRQIKLFNAQAVQISHALNIPAKYKQYLWELNQNLL